MYLMCKDAIVLNINTMKVFNQELLPGLLANDQNKALFMDWFHKRYSERSNTASRQLRGILFGQGNRDVINETTHSLSLSDCYWLKDKDSDIKFNNVSPYYNKFWTGEGNYEGGAIPTLYVNGFLTKYWVNKDVLIKKSDKKEVLCAIVAKELGLTTVDIFECDDGIHVLNFTTDHLMFESAEASGKIDSENFTVNDILDVFGEPGYDMLFLDALIGNGDRHAGNFGFLRDANTGEYLGMAPLFDYDHAYDSANDNDILIQEIKQVSMGRWAYRFKELVEMSKKSKNLDDYMKKRLVSLYK